MILKSYNKNYKAFINSYNKNIRLWKINLYNIMESK